MRLHRKDGNNYQRQRRCSAKGTVRLYCSWCSLRYHVTALSKASCTLAKPVEGFRIVSGNTFVQWRASNRTPATREVVSPWPNASIYTWPQLSPWHASVCGKASERRSANTTTQGKTAHFPTGHTSPRGLEQQAWTTYWLTTCARNICQAHQRHSTRVR